MTEISKPTPADIRAWRAANPKMRERDIAAALGVPEAALVAAEAGLTATRIDASVNRLLNRAKELGEVMVLTRNESAVHEKIGFFENITTGERVSLTLGKQIDLRIFNTVWAHGFAVTKRDNGQEKLSLQYFDMAGDAMFKLHLRPASDIAAYRSIVAELRLDDQSQTFDAVTAGASTANGERAAVPDAGDATVDREVLRDNWRRLTDTHEFFGMLKRLKIGRQAAMRTVGEDYAWQLQRTAVADMFHAAANARLPIMCFVASKGTVQIHSGPISNIQAMGPWINIMDPTFHLHLRQDHVAEVWGVRKPTRDGHVTSLEAYNSQGEMIIQFFGKRKEGSAELETWRGLVENLPRTDASAAA